MQMSLNLLQLSSPTCGSFLLYCLQILSAFSVVALPCVFVHGDSADENKKRQATQRFREEAQLHGAVVLFFQGKTRQLCGFLVGEKNASFKGLNS